MTLVPITQQYIAHTEKEEVTHRFNLFYFDVNIRMVISILIIMLEKCSK